MGQRMPDEPHEYGDDCLAGFDAGKTPKYLYARFSLLIKCPAGDYQPPNDRLFKLTQVIGQPCRWFGLSNDWMIDFVIGSEPVGTNIELHNDDDGLDYFLDFRTAPIEEGYVYHNDIVACNGGLGAKNGLAVITWTQQATQLLEDMNITRGDDLFMELRPLENGKLVYKFCRIKESMNIKFLLEL